MTSMPASRRARAMILAPRSCPSRPGLAITTRIFPGTWAEYRGAPHSHRLLARVAEPGQRALRLHARGERDAAPARLWAWRARPAPRVGALAADRRHRDHSLASRPLGRPGAVGLGDVLSLDERAASQAGAVGAAGRT